MDGPAADNLLPMDLRLERAPASLRGSPDVTRRRLSPAEFSDRLEAAHRTLWTVAAAVLGARTDAEDVLQDAAMIGLAKLDDFDGDTSFSAWMSGIVRNVARNHARKRQRRHTAATDPVSIDQSRAAAASVESTPDFDRRGRFSPDQSPFDDAVVAALNILEETARACLLLRTLRDMPYKEIAQVLGIPEGTAMSHVHRARQALRSHLSQGSGDRP
jgi:RNA polymerase sigma-70 factor, ECF subfamily